MTKNITNVENGINLKRFDSILSVFQLYSKTFYTNHQNYFSLINNIKYSLQLFIDNEFVDAVSGRKFPTINPADGKVIAEISEGDKVKFIILIITSKNIRNVQKKTQIKLKKNWDPMDKIE